MLLAVAFLTCTVYDCSLEVEDTSIFTVWHSGLDRAVSYHAGSNPITSMDREVADRHVGLTGVIRSNVLCNSLPASHGFDSTNRHFSQDQ